MQLNKGSNSLYKILKVKKKATNAEIKAAYRKLSKEHHPDTGGEESKFKEICRAYEVLIDPVSRKNYDDTGLVADSASYEERAFALIRELFTELIASSIKLDQDVNYVNAILDYLNEGKAKLESNLIEIERRKEALKNKLGRVKRISGEGPNMFDDLINQLKGSLEDEEKTFRYELAINKQAKTILNDYAQDLVYSSDDCFTETGAAVTMNLRDLINEYATAE